MERAARMAIGKLSKETGTNIETIRYYERVALLPTPARSEGGYRLYQRDHRKRLNFVRRGGRGDEARDAIGDGGAR